VALLLLLSRRRAGPYDAASLLVATCAMAAGGWFFTRYADVNDHFNLLGHVYKLVGCVYLYRAIFLETVERPYRDLADAQARLRATLEAVPDLLWLKDGQGVFLDCNPAFERLYGAPRSRIVGRTDLDFVDAEQAAFFRRHDRKAMAGGGPSVNEEWLQFAGDGHCGLYETVKTPVRDADGRTIGVLGIARDITERRHAEGQRQVLEAQLREAQKMESLGTLAGGIAHDFNNVLGAIRGHAELARELLPPGHPARDNLEQIGRAGRRARDLVQQILAFSRRQPQCMQRQPLRPLVEETVALLGATLPARVRLSSRLDDAPLSVNADATQIQQVLMNLGTNAWHALGDGSGEVEIGLRTVVLEAPQAQALGLPAAGRWAQLWVRDTGAGMDEATRARIFEPFFTTKAPGKGTGLGLSVVHGIVSAHGGAIGVVSAPGAGSRFDVYLPVAAPAAEDAPAAADAPLPAPASGRGSCVLVVDDDEVMLLMVEQLLSRHGWRVSTRSRAADALALVRTDPQAVDAVVTDFNMPDGSGLELAAALKVLRPDLPVLVSSGYLSEELMAGARTAGVRRVLQKQDTLEQLPRLLGELLPA
jgi:PAS domain S-box-containing protein